jgi:hypothetical protein
MIKDAEQFKAADKDFQAKHEAKVSPLFLLSSAFPRLHR